MRDAATAAFSSVRSVRGIDRLRPAAAAGRALLATALLDVLLLGTPRPFTFFAWITGLADVVAAAAPFTQPAPLASKIFPAIINVVVGVAVIALLSGVGCVAIRPVVPPTLTVTGVGPAERPASR